jgi:hypothetical protein
MIVHCTSIDLILNSFIYFFLLKYSLDGERWISLTEFENDILNSYTRMDQSVVRAIRHAASSYIIQHQADDIHGITLKDAILPSYPTCRFPHCISSVSSPHLTALLRTLDAYCEEYVMRMGVDAEGPLVDMGILFSLLQSKGTLVMFDRRSSPSHYLTDSS